MIPEPEYLTLDEGATLLRFDVTSPANPRKAFGKWLRRHAVPVLRRGRVLLVERRVLVAMLKGDAWAIRRSA
jgi:hypothetical protein